MNPINSRSLVKAAIMMMFWLLSPAFLCAQHITLPDTIYLNNGQIIPCRLLDLSATFVQYKSTDSGPDWFRTDSVRAISINGLAYIA
jgi:hypothetical protein